MEPYFEAAEPEHFKAVADPTRQRIMSLLFERAATTKQLAEALGQLPGTIAHHLKVLEGVGFVRVVRTRQVRAITEKYYGNTYRRLTLTARNFSWQEELPEMDPYFHFQQAANEYDFSALSGEKPPGTLIPMSVLQHARIPASRAEKFARKVIELAEEFEQESVPGERVYAFLGSVFLTNLPELPGDEEER